MERELAWEHARAEGIGCCWFRRGVGSVDLDLGKVEAAGWLGCSGRIPRKVEIGWRREEGNRLG